MNLLKGHYENGTVRLPSDNLLTVSDKAKTLLGKVIGTGEVVVGFRPESVVLKENGQLRGSVYASDLHGGYTMLHLSLGSDIVHARGERRMKYAMNTPLRFDLKPEQVRFFDPKTEKSIK
jgi:multiple sugar transport system ATP-binding protein